MKKLVLLAAISSILGITACQNNSTKKTNDDAASGKSQQLPGKMEEFMKMLDGTSDGATKAYTQFASKGLKDNNLNKPMEKFCEYNLKDPQVISVLGSCCTMEAKSGITTRKYKVCWVDNTISGIEFIEMK